MARGTIRSYPDQGKPACATAGNFRARSVAHRGVDHLVAYLIVVAGEFSAPQVRLPQPIMDVFIPPAPSLPLTMLSVLIRSWYVSAFYFLAFLTSRAGL